MRQPAPKPAAAQAMAANRIKDRQDAQMATLMEQLAATANRVVELTEKVGELQDRIEALEAR
ncbi:MAG: hypothetical protein HZT43_01340 [Exiguobacterium profundum]|nr:MAG: hypothetical protein HZT43_01340 [Exiguobacterium profundum]